MIKNLIKIASLISLIFLSSCFFNKKKSEGNIYNIPKIEELTLKNGLTVLFVKDDELPIVKGTLFLKGGSFLDNEKVVPSSTSFMGAMLRNGGTLALSPKELDEKLELLSASIGSSFSTEFGNISFESLSNDFEEVFKIFSDVLLHPRFDEDEFNLLKTKSLDDINRRKDDPDTIAGLSINQILYKSLPYGMVVTSPDINKVSISNLRDQYAKYINPQNSILIITGRIDKKVMKQVVNTNLGMWTNDNKNNFDFPEVNTIPTSGIYFVEGPFTQSTIILGKLGVDRLNDDYFKILLFNEILGTSGMSSLLSSIIRTDLGLAYSVYGGVGFGVKKGKTLISIQTKAESTGNAIEKTMEILNDVKTKKIEINEIDEKKAALVNSFVFSNENPFQTLTRQAVFRLYGFPSNFDEVYIDKIKDINAENILNMAQKYFNLDDMILVVVGSKNAYSSLKDSIKNFPPPYNNSEIITLKFNEKLEGF